jgi:hypothetical protein
VHIFMALECMVKLQVYETPLNSTVEHYKLVIQVSFISL